MTSKSISLSGPACPRASDPNRMMPVDVIVVTPGDIEKFAGKVGTIIPAALAEGKEVYAA
jgi:hypothetical protein